MRVAEDEDEAETASNVIGTVGVDGSRSGMQALLTAASQLGFVPRILGTPGLETQPVTSARAWWKKLRGFVYARAIGATIPSHQISLTRSARLARKT
ncbi:hypothetical protein SBA_ch1_31340 [Sphingomonas bisphenolicum]|uniref:Uncharacterized protein n=1 Tax=Sphingomonas bisphenolicum TaxID=296544 RepID=A0ABM7G0Q2_9SPHN|nr:hypothetical protein SBA_ch1_31340 [Sphingomonas bisphenolicum]